MRKGMAYNIHAIDYTLMTRAVMDSTVRTLTENPALTFPVRRIDRLVICAEKSRIEVIPRALPLSREGCRSSRRLLT